MATTITYFTTAKELEQLTNLSHDELWNIGFDLDDIDFGLMADEDLGDTLMMLMLRNRCTDCHEKIYNKKYYCLFYH